jgi:hypothetical protein
MASAGKITLRRNTPERIVTPKNCIQGTVKAAFRRVKSPIELSDILIVYLVDNRISTGCCDAVFESIQQVIVEVLQAYV